MTLRGHDGEVSKVTFSPDGRIIASASCDSPPPRRSVALTGPSGSGTPPPGERRPSSAANPLVLKTSHSVLTEDASRRSAPRTMPMGGKIVRLWNVATGGEAFTLPGHTAPGVPVAFSPDGRRCLLRLGGHAEDLGRRLGPGDPDLPRARRSSQGPGIQPRWTPHRFGFEGGESAGRRLRPGSQGAAPGRGDPACMGLGFSPDGRILAGAIASNLSVNVDNNVKLWDTTTGLELMILRGHPARVFALAFRPDGRRIASSYMDGTVWLWDVATGSPS